jgi:predicted nuclease of predicted toxin-antitoxin system
MRILVDENIPRMTVEGLRALGHDAKDIRGTSDRGAADSDLWKLALAECRALVTTDKGFTE